MASQVVLLVDGPLSPFRARVAEVLTTRYVTFLTRGYISTPPEMYVRMMAAALDDYRPVVIECSWITQAQHSALMPEITRNVFNRFEAQRHMLDRIALGCGAICVRPLDNSANLRDLWVRNDPIIPTLTFSEWDEEVFLDLEYKIMHNRNPGPGIGKWAPGQVILLVGDRPGDTIQPYKVERNLAFCSMSGVGCSEWLTTQIHNAGIREDQLYWVNAKDSNKPRFVGHGMATTPNDFIDALEPIEIIAMGEAAAQWCSTTRRSFKQVNHPQYWMRFHHNEEYPLIPLLKEKLCIPPHG